MSDFSLFQAATVFFVYVVFDILYALYVLCVARKQAMNGKDQEHRMSDETKPQEGKAMSPASAGSRPVAWAALNDDGDIAWIGYTEEGAACAAAGRTIVPLYTHPVPPDRPVGLGFDDMRLTDDERKAILRAAAVADAMHDYRLKAALGGLLERLT